MFINAWRPQQLDVREAGRSWLCLCCWMTHSVTPRRTHSLNWRTLSYTYKHIHTRIGRRAHILGHAQDRFWRRGGRAVLSRTEGLLIKTHRGCSFSTGGRVVQEHRDAPAGSQKETGQSCSSWMTQATAETLRERTPRAAATGLFRESHPPAVGLNRPS